MRRDRSGATTCARDRTRGHFPRPAGFALKSDLSNTEMQPPGGGSMQRRRHWVREGMSLALVVAGAITAMSGCGGFFCSDGEGSCGRSDQDNALLVWLGGPEFLPIHAP